MKRRSPSVYFCRLCDFRTRLCDLDAGGVCFECIERIRLATIRLERAKQEREDYRHGITLLMDSFHLLPLNGPSEAFVVLRTLEIAKKAEKLLFPNLR